MALRANYQGIKKVIDPLVLTTEGTLSAGSIPEELNKKASIKLLQDTVGWVGTNHAKPFEWSGNAGTLYWVYDGKGKCTINGINAEDRARPTITNIVDNKLYYTLPKGNYKVGVSSDLVGIRVYNADTTELISSGDNFTLDNSTNIGVAIACFGNKQYSNLEVYYWIYDADSAENTYIPYHATVDDSKAEISVIGTYENGSTASKNYLKGDYFYKDGKLGVVTAEDGVAQGATWTLNTNYSLTDIATVLKGFDGRITVNESDKLDISTLKTISASSADFAAFQAAIANL